MAVDKSNEHGLAEPKPLKDVQKSNALYYFSCHLNGNSCFDPLTLTVHTVYISM